jgi:hypothetical protein
MRWEQKPDREERVSQLISALEDNKTHNTLSHTQIQKGRPLCWSERETRSHTTREENKEEVHCLKLISWRLCCRRMADRMQATSRTRHPSHKGALQHAHTASDLSSCITLRSRSKVKGYGPGILWKVRVLSALHCSLGDVKGVQCVSKNDPWVMKYLCCCMFAS